MDLSRIQKLTSRLNFPCLINKQADLLYLTGLSLSKGRLLILPDQSILFVDGRYYDRAKKEAPCPVMLWEEQEKWLKNQIGFDSANVTYEEYLTLKKTFPEVEFIPFANPLKEIRAVKEPLEIAALKKAAHLTWQGYQKIREALKVGISEEELALLFEMFCREKGASGLSFEPIVAFGENSAYPHHRAGKTRLKENQVVLIDVGAVVDQYHGDMTRIVHFGTPDPRIVHFEKLVSQAKKEAMDQIKPGVLLGSLDQVVQDVFDQANVKPLYKHSLGHGIGLETHEFPRLRFDGEDRDILLQEGMVFTIEPGLYQPGVGGVRLEDMVVVTKNGYENLSHAEF
jgi:Xaa-Pro aminopeptidase